MQINEQFWGDMSKSQTWVPGVTITNYTMLDAFNQTENVTWTLPLNDELDTSICPWAINKDADIVKLAYPISYRIDPDNTYDAATPKFYPVHDYESEMSGIPVYFVVPGYTGGGANGFNWYARNGNDVAYIQPTTDTRYRDMVYPVRDFDYSKLCVSLQLAYTDNTTSTASVNYTSFDSYFVAGGESWRATNPVVGLCFRIYGRGWDNSYPDRWQGGNPVSGQQMLINSMGRKKPCEIAPSDATVGYNVDFKDDFMTLVNGDAWGGLAIGAWGNRDGGNGAAYVLSDSGWAQSYEQGAAAELAVSASDHPIIKVPMLEGEENTHWTLYSNYSGGNRAVYFKTMLDASTFANEDELKAYILKQAAYLGMWIYTNGTPQGDPGSDEHWYLGEINSNGVTTGNYRQGSSASELDNSTWTNPWEDGGWSGRSDDPNQYDDNTTELNDTVATKVCNPFVNKYAVDLGQLGGLAAFFYGKVHELTDLADSLTSFFVTNAQDCVVGVRQFPFIVTNYVNSSDKNVTFGVFDSSISAKAFNDSVVLIDAGSCTYYPTLGVNDFRSYPPYSHAELYVPFCGSVNIDPNVYLNHTIGVKYLVDLNTGECLALIYRDGMVVDSIAGSMSVDIPFSGVDRAAYDASKRQAETNSKNAKSNALLSGAAATFGIVAGAVTGNPLAIGAGVGALTKTATIDKNNISQAEYNLNHVQIPYRVQGTASAATSFANERRCRLIIYRPMMLSYDAATYGHTVGYACIRTGTISEFSGYTQISNVDLSGLSATDAELDMIRAMLSQGVII